MKHPAAYSLEHAFDLSLSAFGDFNFQKRPFRAEIISSSWLIRPALDDAKKAKMKGVAVFAVIYNGQFLADRQISKSSFRNIMNKILGG